MLKYQYTVFSGAAMKLKFSPAAFPGSEKSFRELFDRPGQAVRKGELHKKPFKIIGVNDWLTGLSLNPALSCHPERNDKPKSITSSARGVAAGDGDESTYSPLDLLHKCSI